MAKLTKKQAQELNNKIVEIAENFGAVEDSGGRWLSLNTKYGNLKIKPSNESGDTVVTVFCKFDEPEKARHYLNCNPHTGKWNFHRWAEDVDILPGYFEREIGRILNV